MIQALIGPVASLLDKFIPDATEKQRLAAEIATMAERHGHEIALAQIDVNKEEAKQDVFPRRLETFYWLDLRYCVCLPLCATTPPNFCDDLSRPPYSRSARV
jgi:hypothetical protein